LAVSDRAFKNSSTRKLRKSIGLAPEVGKGAGNRGLGEEESGEAGIMNEGGSAFSIFPPLP
jgi:hypothetical protein